ncbi:hypothetical protein GCM10027176_50850 [Actinoallomurus bryophytorum]
MARDPAPPHPSGQTADQACCNEFWSGTKSHRADKVFGTHTRPASHQYRPDAADKAIVGRQPDLVFLGPDDDESL